MPLLAFSTHGRWGRGTAKAGKGENEGANGAFCVLFALFSGGVSLHSPGSQELAELYLPGPLSSKGDLVLIVTLHPTPPPLTSLLTLSWDHSFLSQEWGAELAFVSGSHCDRARAL
jgi:hypothetical protein